MSSEERNANQAKCNWNECISPILRGRQLIDVSFLKLAKSFRFLPTSIDLINPTQHSFHRRGIQSKRGKLLNVIENIAANDRILPLMVFHGNR